jgi:hypothetical protein
MKTKSSTLEGIGWGILILWIIRNFFHFFMPYGGAEGVGQFIGGTLGDLRVWLLVVGLLLVHYRNQKR